MSGGQNNSRLVSMTYPNGRVIDYNYNSGIDSSISRLSSISDSTGTLESYLYLGLDTVVERDHPQTGVNETMISQTGSTGDAGDQYTGLDRFGRVVEVNWYDTNTDTSTDDIQYGYDQDGNVLYADNMLEPSDSELYTYDDLNQLTTFERGTLSASPPGGQLNTIANPSETESWTLDALGNFTAVTVNGTQTDATFNQQNEETTDGSASLTYDANGNTLTDASGNTYKYNAWNQLVSVSNGGTTIATYTVNGLGQRVTENEGGTLTDVYFSAQWQVVEEDVGGTMTNQYVWSPVYVNAMIERDTPTQRLYVQQDADWNVTSLVNTSGSVVERYLYDPYGAVTYLTAGWSTESQSAYGWHYLFQGGRLDTATGLYEFENRDYSPTLQRWAEADPSGYAGSGSNLYATESDDPVDETDPTGLRGPDSASISFEEAIVSGDPDKIKLIVDLLREGNLLTDAQEVRAMKTLRTLYEAGGPRSAKAFSVLKNVYTPIIRRLEGSAARELTQGETIALEENVNGILENTAPTNASKGVWKGVLKQLQQKRFVNFLGKAPGVRAKLIGALRISGAPQHVIDAVPK